MTSWPRQRSRRPPWAVASFTKPDCRLDPGGWSGRHAASSLGRLRVDCVTTPDRPEHHSYDDQDGDGPKRIQLELTPWQLGYVAEPILREQARPQGKDRRSDDPELGEDDAGPRAGVAARHHEGPAHVRVL